MLYLLDTDICSYVIKPRSPALLMRIEQARLDDIALSVITRSELLYGWRKKSGPPALHQALLLIFSQFESLPWDDKAADMHADLRNTLERRGTPIGGNDTMIAAHALALDATLVTNNEKHFNQVPGLRIDNWTR